MKLIYRGFPPLMSSSGMINAGRVSVQINGLNATSPNVVFRMKEGRVGTWTMFAEATAGVDNLGVAMEPQDVEAAKRRRRRDAEVEST